MTERPRLSVVGTGYLGVTHAVCMAELGYEVIGLDVDADKIALLRKGVVPFYEPDLPDLLEKHNGRGAAVHHGLRRDRRGRRIFTSSAWARPSCLASTRLTSATSSPRSRR